MERNTYSMKIKQIKEKEGVFHVTLKPNFLERLLGKEEKTVRFKKDNFAYFQFGGGGIYIREDGVKLSNGSYIGEELDKFSRKISYFE